MEVNIWGLKFSMTEFSVMCICTAVGCFAFFNGLSSVNENELRVKLAQAKSTVCNCKEPK